MRLIEISPARLAQMHGFEETRQALRGESELPLFADSNEYDLNLYEAMWESGVVKSVAVLDGDTLMGWGLLTRAVIPRRRNMVYATDIMWSANPQAGSMVLRHFLKVASPEPLFITARVGGRLDVALSKSGLSTHTHNVYTLQQPNSSSVRS